jgi:exodeoxyribonuclease VII large subunit
MPDTAFPKNYASLSEILSQVRTVVARGFPAPLWIKAEMLKLNHYSASGHAFPELVEKQNGKIAAKCQSMIWASDLQRIATNFLNITGKHLSDGIEILFYAEVKFHEQYGMRLRIIDIDAQFTLGQMALERKKTIERLKSEGLFFLNKQILMPVIPARLAVISAATSRGLHDLKNIIFSTGTSLKIKMTLFSAILQGERGAETIENRLKQIGKRAAEFDAVLIIRGGGDDTGMDCYDNFSLARSVCECPLPVITGIGHSTNLTVTEMVAHTNKITPTDVGYFIIGCFYEQITKLQEISSQLNALALMCVAEHEQVLHDYAFSVADIAKGQFQHQKDFLLSSENFLQQKAKQNLILAHNDINANVADLQNKIKQLFIMQQHKTESINLALKQNSLSILMQKKSSLQIIENKVSLLDPQNILNRGYSITLHNGKIVKNSKELKDGSKIETVFAKGRIKSTVNKKQ